MNIKMLKKQEIKNIFSMNDAIEAVKTALLLYSAGECNVPLRTNIALPQQSANSLFMMGYVENAKALGIKIVSVFPNNVAKGIAAVPATMILMNESTGEVCCILDGEAITKLRTGAVCGVATQALSRENSEVFALLGTGGQAAAQLEAVLCVRDIKKVFVYSRNAEKTALFVQKMQKKFSVEIIAAKSAEQAVQNADIITAVTTSSLPVFEGEMVKKGAHINGVGSFKPTMQELDDYIVCTADKVFVDTRNGALNEAGDFIVPINKGLFSANRITGELGELLNKNAIGRENEQQITLFKTTGFAALDLVTAKGIYDKAQKLNIGECVEF